MKNILKCLKPMVCASLVIAGLFTASLARADTADTSEWLDNGTSDVPPTQLSGWFFNPDTTPFPAPSDPSEQWTSQANIDLINYWLSLVSDLADDPSSAGAVGDPSASTELQDQVQTLVVAPEPATFSMLGGGLAMLGIYGVRRTRRVR